MAFRDGLGERRDLKDPSGTSAEVLCLRRELATVPSFEFALRERMTRLAGFRHAYYGRVRSVERSTEFDHALTVTSDAMTGIRLSALLDTSHEQRLPIDLDVALCLIRQLVPAVAILHETARDASHGALGPERLVVTPAGRLVIVEYVLGSALEQLLFTRERYWTELRIALPRVAGLPRFDHLTDVTQVGVVALSLILGRTLGDDEYPARIGEVVANATATTARGETEPLPATVRSWLQRALQLDPRHSFPSAIEARADFERVLADSGYDASPASLDAFMKKYHAAKASSVAPIAPPVVPVARPSVVLAQPVNSESKPASTASSPGTLEPAPSIRPVSPSEQPTLSASTTDSDREFPEDFPNTMAARRSTGKLIKVAAGVVIGTVLLGGGVLVGARRFMADEPVPSPTGTLVVTTNPPGAEAFVDGVRRGNTPLTITLLAGSHNVELRGYGEPRIIPVAISVGQHVAQYVDLPTLAPAETHAAAPTTQSAAADHPAADVPANGPGWIAVGGKLEMQLFESGHLLGTSKIERIMVPAGHHDLEMVNELLGYRGTRSVQVSPGKVTTITVEIPKGSVAINALPWAEVWMDGTKLGETPIGNLAVPAGSHDLVFRHPDFGERRETVLVTLNAPVRLSVDMRKP
jgi:serine/threonine-protein kinase